MPDGHAARTCFIAPVVQALRGCLLSGLVAPTDWLIPDTATALCGGSGRYVDASLSHAGGVAITVE